MPNYCIMCGKPVELCTCQNKPNQPDSFPVEKPGNFCTQCGKPMAECTCGKSPVVNKTALLTSVKNFFGFSESDANKKEDCFETGKMIVPDLIDPCEAEIPIKQYEIGRVRRRLNLSWGYSRMQITNKRIIHRTVGRSIIGKDIQYQEFAIDDIAGLNFNKGKQFSIGDFLLLLLLSVILGGIGYALNSLFPDSAPAIICSVFAVLAIVAWAYIKFGLKKSSNVLFAFMFAFATGMCAAPQSMGITDIIFDGPRASSASPVLAILVCFIFFIVYLIRASLLPSVSVFVKTRVFASDGAKVSAGTRVTNFKINSIILPGCDVEKALREMGAIITDVQKLGDYAIEKWSNK